MNQPRAKLLEADLYAPVKAHLEACGYAVRGEVMQCDMLGWDAAAESLVAVELKRGFGLPVLYQALKRLSAADLAYVGVGTPEGAAARRNWDAQLPAAVKLCRMLGLGLLSVRHGQVVVHADPGPFAPRHFATRRAKLLSEFQRRSGDHNIGGTTRRPRMTAYREDALRCAARLADGPLAPLALRDLVPKAAMMLRRNVYGWFEKQARAQYALSAAGAAALVEHAAILAAQATRLNAAGSTAGSSAPPPRKARGRQAPPPAPGNHPVPSPAAPAS